MTPANRISEDTSGEIVGLESRFRISHEGAYKDASFVELNEIRRLNGLKGELSVRKFNDTYIFQNIMPTRPIMNELGMAKSHHLMKRP